MICLAVWDGISWKAVIGNRGYGQAWHTVLHCPTGRNATAELALQWSKRIAANIQKTRENNSLDRK